MQKTTIKNRLLAALLTLCMVLSLVPMSAFAAEIDFLPQGVTSSRDYKHAYHTQVNVTANVSVKDSNGTVVKTTQISKSSGDYLKGAVDIILQSNIAKLQDEIETPYKAKGTVTSENGHGQMAFDHFESAEFYTFTPASGDLVNFSTDLEAAKQYFNEHPDATGVFTELTDVYEYQKYNYTYDLIVQENSQSESTITAATIENAKFNYQPGDAPQATAWVAIDDTDKYKIAYECWQQFDGNEPVAAWYSDNGSHGTLPTITKFESGKKYVYSLMLKPKNGYSFSSKTVITVNGQKVSAPFVGGSMYIPAIKTITLPTVTAIDVVEINGVTVSFKDGDKPVFTGKVPDGVNYAYRGEWWELDSNTGLMSTEPEWGSDIYKNKITAFEAGKTYHYGVYVTAVGFVEEENVTYIFTPDTKLKINGKFVNYHRYEGDTSDGSDGTMWVLTDLTMTPEAGGSEPSEKYTVTYTDGVDDEEIFEDQTYTVASGEATPDFDGTPTRDGYLFTGWEPKVAKTVTGSATYTAQWEQLPPAETYTVTYTDGVDDEEIFEDQTYTVESGEATPDFDGTPTREGYTFAGWEPAVAEYVTDDAIYEATWTSDPTTPSKDKSKTDKTTSSKTGKTASPKTGDTSNVPLWFALLFVSGGAVIGTTVVIRKKKYHR